MNLQYPLGMFSYEGALTQNVIHTWIDEIEALPRVLREAVNDLTDVQLNTPYRPGGWTVRQVVHHLADSHMNAYIRFKLALTEEAPTIKLYDEAKWAVLPDAELPIDVSLSLLATLHLRWTTVLRSLTEEDLHKSFIHPENGSVSLAKNIGLYAWHGNHHVAHIQALRKRQKW